ncbi:pilus assembly protein TadG-related protein [[Kitasatospora] papulosa]|uniref:pilus assembly protein TadG-related protein n=1 Tax=[Kitasatospora] papulosa TaxID=1464011 RepID=UPI003691E1C1
MTAGHTHEAGQAFPIYIMVVAGLLFLAFAYFAVGQASMKKNEAQTAADAAALAAAQEARDRWSWPGVFDLEQWDDLLDGRGAVSGACDAAEWLAAENDAHLTGPGCFANDWPEVSYTVTVETNKSVGDSVIASTKTTKATANARAVIEPRCRIEEDTRPTPSLSADDDDGDTDESEEQKAYKAVCDDEDLDFDIDPKNLKLLPDLSDLFSVHLADK